MLPAGISSARYWKNLYIAKPDPIIERAVRIHAISVLSAAIIVRLRARSVRSSARTVPLSFGAVSTRLIGPFLKCAPHGSAAIRLHTSRAQWRQNQHEPA